MHVRMHIIHNNSTTEFEPASPILRLRRSYEDDGGTHGCGGGDLDSNTYSTPFPTIHDYGVGEVDLEHVAPELS